MNFRKASMSDALGIAKVHVDTWKSAYKGMISDEYLQNLDYKDREKRWKKRIKTEKKNHFFYVAEDDSRNIVGFAVGALEQFEPNKEDPITSKYDGELLAIYVLEDYQRQGIGSHLVQEVIKDFLKCGISSMLVWVLKTSRYRAFYEKLGGKYLAENYKEIGGNKYKIVSYGWENINKIAIQ